MKLKTLLISTIFAFAILPMFAQDGGIKGKVVSRNGREAVGNVKVTIDGVGTATTDQEGNFSFQNLPQGSYTLSFQADDFETLDLIVNVEKNIRDLNNVVVVPTYSDEMDDSIFTEFDSEEASSDAQALPSSLSASKDLFTNIASYKFSEMRFNLRGYDSQYSDTYLNGIRFNDAMTGYGPWSLWSGLNDATRNQNATSGLQVTDYGIGGISGSSNINARASQMRKGFRVSVTNGNSMYRLRAMVSYASGALDNGWSYAFSFSTRQGGNGYVDGVYYNSYGYFASVEKVFRSQHRLALTLLGTPQQRGAQQASTNEAYKLFGSNYYNPNVGFQDGKMRNTRVRNSHEPIVMLNYYYDITSKTRLTAATSFRFGQNGYSALTWRDGADPRPDYYRYLPSNYTSQIQRAVNGVFDAQWNGFAISENQFYSYLDAASQAARIWNGRIDFDNLIRSNQNGDASYDSQSGMSNGKRANYMIEERHTDQLDWNFVANISHEFNANHHLVAGINARINRTNYYDKVKDLLGGDYWLDVDKFAERDMGSNPEAFQNDYEFYRTHGYSKKVIEGDRFSYDYYAHLQQAAVWALYGLHIGGFTMEVGGEAGYTSMWREGLLRKGLFLQKSLGNSLKINNFTYKIKGNFSYRFSGAHALSANIAMMQVPPSFSAAFVSPRTRNDITPGLSTEKIFSSELTYDLNLPFLKARLAAFYTTMNDISKVISFYDDTQSSYTNFAMSGIDKRHYGVELGLSIPIWNGLALQGALSWGDYRYTSNPTFVQTVDNSAEVKLIDKVNWKDFYVEGSPQTAANIGLNWRAPHNWFINIDFNYYRDAYLSMNPAYRTTNAVKPYVNIIRNQYATSEAKAWAAGQITAIRSEENLGSAYTLNASVGKYWYIHRKYMLGFNLEVKNILNNQNLLTGGYEQMRLLRTRGKDGNGGTPSVSYYSRFDSKYFYMLGTNYYANIYFRF